jgi:hypothetical protein
MKSKGNHLFCFLGVLTTPGCESCIGKDEEARCGLFWDTAFLIDA